MKSFLAALMFLTRIPVPTIHVSNSIWKKSAVFYPLVGFIIGSLLMFAYLGLKQLFSPPVTAFLIVLLWIWITGGLHIDGWMDLADGFGSNRSLDEMLKIMKDSRVGAMGVIAAILLIMGKWVAVYELLQLDLPIILIFSPLYARFLLINAIKFWPYRNDGGLGEGLQTYLTMPIMLVNFLLIIVITYIFTGLNGILLIFVTAIAVGFFILKIYHRLTMLTGDCYGAIVEWSECISLFLALAIWRLVG